MDKPVFPQQITEAAKRFEAETAATNRGVAATPDSRPSTGYADAHAKAEAFDRLIHDLAEKLPIESRIRKLYGLPLAQALEGFVIVPREEWEKHRHIVGSEPPLTAQPTTERKP